MICSKCNINKKIKFKIDELRLCDSCISMSDELSDLVSQFGKLKKELLEQDVNQVLKKERKIARSIRKIIKSSDDEKRKTVSDKIKQSLKDKSIDSDEPLVHSVLNKMTLTGLNQCKQTIDTCNNVIDLQDKIKESSAYDNIKLPNPKDLKSRLDLSIIKQDHAKRTLSSALVLHLCRLKNKDLKKKNILIMGPSGSGKTELIRVLSKEITLPLIELDATSFTAAAYQGASVEQSIANEILAVTNGNLELAGQSIVFIDEIDKKSNDGVQSGASTSAVQDELLKIVEGRKIHGTFAQKEVTIDTSNILFIVAGAFSKLRESKQVRKIGLNLTKNLDLNFTDQDMVSAGFSPEFLGRFSVRTFTEQLTAEDYLQILQLKSNSLLDQYKSIFRKFNCTLTFSNEFLVSIANKALNNSVIGARSLENLLASTLDQEIFFNIYEYAGKTIQIDKNGNPKVIKRKIIN